jgi:hypothetical protein
VNTPATSASVIPQIPKLSSATGDSTVLQLGMFERKDPVTDPSWDALLSANSQSSFFHSSAWARVLHETYAHTPFYLCRVKDSKLESLLPVMEVSSRLTGRRGVSLPFTDICPALSAGDNGRALFAAALELGRERNWRYFESRNGIADWPEARPSVSFYCHTIDLQGEPESLFKRLGSSLRRGIRKAQEEGLAIEFDAKPEAISTYYSLHCLTRRKHGVPPQPSRFFESIGRHVLGTGKGFVGLARWQGATIAAAVYLYHGRQAFYKFGASDYRFQHLRPNNLLMWEAMKHCAALGCSSLHLGRTSLVNDGLRRFKQSFGANEETLAYAKFDFRRAAFVEDVDRAEGPLNKVFRLLPPPLFRLAGAMLYPHLS